MMKTKTRRLRKLKSKCFIDGCLERIDSHLTYCAAHRRTMLNPH